MAGIIEAVEIMGILQRPGDGLQVDVYCFLIANVNIILEATIYPGRTSTV